MAIFNEIGDFLKLRNPKASQITAPKPEFKMELDRTQIDGLWKPSFPVHKFGPHFRLFSQNSSRAMGGAAVFSCAKELAAYLIARRALSLRPEQRLQSLCGLLRFCLTA